MVQQTAIEGPDITNYWQYFNLDRDPFAMNADDALIFLPAYWEEMLDLVQYLVHYKNQLVVITGFSGTGKTVFADLLIAQLGESLHLAKIGAESNLDVMRFIEFLSDSFLLPWHPEHGIEQLLDDQLNAFQHKDKNCLLLIDNAQLLPTETLEALLYLVGQQSDNQMRFHVVLLGETSLQNTLERMLEPAEEGLIHFLTLSPLGLSETEAYLAHRLSVADWQNDSPMTEEIIARIYRLSEGNPARINRIARRFLLDMLNEQEDHPKRFTRLSRYATQLLGASLIVAILAALGLWIWHARDHKDIHQVIAATKQISAPKIVVNGQELTEVSTPLPPMPPSAAPTTPAAPVASLPTASVTPAVSSSAVVPAVEVGHKVDVPAVTAVPVVAPVAPVTAAPVVTPKVLAEPSTAPVSTAAASAESPSVPASTAVSPPLKAKSIKPKVPVHTAAPALAQSKKVKGQAQANKLVAAEEQGSYTIRLLGLTHEAALSTFIKNNHLEGKLRIETHKVGSKIEHVVYYGSYKTMHDAEQAIASLPATLINAAPWPEKYVDKQKAPKARA